MRGKALTTKMIYRKLMGVSWPGDGIDDDALEERIEELLQTEQNYEKQCNALRMIKKFFNEYA